MLSLYRHGTVDAYSFDLTVFRVQHLTVYADDKKISMALNGLSVRQKEFILLHCFRDMSDREIFELYHISRSAVGYMRNRG